MCFKALKLLTAYSMSGGILELCSDCEVIKSDKVCESCM